MCMRTRGSRLNLRGLCCFVFSEVTRGSTVILSTFTPDDQAVGGSGLPQGLQHAGTELEGAGGGGHDGRGVIPRLPAVLDRKSVV